MFDSSRCIDRVCKLTFLGHMATLTSGQILKLIFRGQRTHVTIRFDETNTMMPIMLLQFDRCKSFREK